MILALFLLVIDLAAISSHGDDEDLWSKPDSFSLLTWQTFEGLDHVKDL